jgi:hypothetical protein
MQQGRPNGAKRCITSHGSGKPTSRTPELFPAPHGRAVRSRHGPSPTLRFASLAHPEGFLPRQELTIFACNLERLAAPRSGHPLPAVAKHPRAECGSPADRADRARLREALLARRDPRRDEAEFIPCEIKGIGTVFVPLVHSMAQPSHQAGSLL